MPLAKEPLVTAADTYFRQSEQIPTFIRLAVARHYGPAEGGGARTSHWRAGGLMIQQLPRGGGKRELEGEAHDLSLEGDDDENWNRARHLAATVEDHELLDSTLSPDRLLYRLFHEEGVRVVPATDVTEACRSRERIELYLKRFGAEELADLREPDGSISVTCEFCSRKYRSRRASFVTVGRPDLLPHLLHSAATTVIVSDGAFQLASLPSCRRHASGMMAGAQGTGRRRIGQRFFGRPASALLMR